MNTNKPIGPHALTRLLLASCMTLLLLTVTGAAAAGAAAGPAAAPNQATAPSAAQIDAMVKTLEDPKARQQLIDQLKLLTKAQGAPAQGPQAREATQLAVQSATTQLIQSLSQHIKGTADTVLTVLGNIDQVPKLMDWVKLQVTNQQARNFWTLLFTHLAMILGLGYVVLYLVRLALLRLRRSLGGRQPRHITGRAGYLLLQFFADLIPIGAFAATAYVALGVINPMESTRLVALAWVNAAILARVVLAVGGVLFAPAAPNLRLIPLSDESANYADI